MRSSNATAAGSSSRPNPAASRSARPRRPSTAAPQVTSAAAVPATVAIPRTAQRRGAGTSTPISAGSHTNVYQSGQAPYGLHSHNPASAATAAHTHAAGRVHGTRCGSLAPRTSAAAASTSATAASHDIHNANPTPPAGGAMPRPRYRTRYGAASTSTAAPTTFHQRRPSPRRHSVLAAQSATTPSTVSAPAEALNAPSTGR